MNMEHKPVVKLSDGSGNAFFIIGVCQRAAKEAGWSKEKINTIRAEMMAGNYDHLLQTAMKYFEVE